MPDIKEKLVWLLNDVVPAILHYQTFDFIEALADQLIANGVTFAEDKNVLTNGVTLESNLKALESRQTNADRLNAMSVEDKAQFLYSIAYARETPWSKPFAEKFCDQCPAPEYTLEDGRKLCLHECDFKDGKCPHGTDIVWWLQQPAEGDA